MSEIATISDTLSRARADGLDISASALRRWVVAGDIPSVRTGKKYLIYYPNLLAFLRGESAGRPASGE